MGWWSEEEWGSKMLQKLEKAVSEQKYRKVVRIVDRIMDEYDVEEAEIWPLIKVVSDEREEEDAGREE